MGVGVGIRGGECGLNTGFKFQVPSFKVSGLKDLKFSNLKPETLNFKLVSWLPFRIMSFPHPISFAQLDPARKRP